MIMEFQVRDFARIGKILSADTTSLSSVYHDDATNPENLILGQFTADVNAPTLKYLKGRGTVAAPADVVSGDRIIENQAFAYSGGTFFNNANIRSYVDAAVVSGQAPAGRLILEVCLANATPTEAVAIFSNGFLVIGSAKVARGVSEANGLLNVAGNATVQAYLECARGDAVGPQLVIKKTRGTLAAPADVVNGDDLGYITWAARSTIEFQPTEISSVVDAAVVAGQMPAGRIAFHTAPANGVKAVWMTIYSGGLVHIGDPATVDTAKRLQVFGSTSTKSTAEIQNTVGGAGADVLKLLGGDNVTTGSKFLSFYRADNTLIGSVTQLTATTVAYNNSSDVRVKENIADSVMGLSALLKIRPRQFNYIADESKRQLNGFIAQELFEVLPEAVTVGSGTACECATLGVKVGGAWNGAHLDTCVFAHPWAVDYSKLTPLLVKAIQELYDLVKPQ